MSMRFGSGGSGAAAVEYSGGAPDPQSGWTLCGWFRVRGTGGDGYQTLFRTHASSGAVTRLNFSTDPSTGLIPTIYTATGTDIAAVDHFVTDKWAFLAITQTGTTATVYSWDDSGTRHSASGTSSGGSAPTGYAMGARAHNDTTEWMNGGERNVAQWSTVLTTTEIEAERASVDGPVKTASLYSYHPMATGTDLSDISGNNRTLTAGVSAAVTEADPFAKNSFEGGSNGTTITTGNSGGTSGNAFDTVNSTGTCTFDNAHAANNSVLAYKMQTTGSTASDVEWTSTSLGANKTIYGRFYIYKTANNATDSIRIITLATAGGAALIGGLYLMTDGTILGARSDVGTACQTTTPLPNNQWSRVEFKIVSHASAGIVEVKTFATDATATTPTETVTGTSQNTNGGDMAIYSVGVGFDVRTATLGPLWFDDIAFSPAGYMGPAPVGTPPAPTAPVVVSRASGERTTNGTTHTITLPGTYSAGDYLFCAFSVDGGPSCAPSAGWTELRDTAQSTNVAGAIYYRQATGSDALTITTSGGANSGSEMSTHITLAIRYTGTPTASTAATGTTTNSDPGSVTPSGSAPYLYVVTRHGDAQVSATAAPTSPATFTNLQTKTATVAGGASTDTAELISSTTPMNPGAFTSASEQWVAYTVGFPFVSPNTDYAKTQTDVEGITDARTVTRTSARTQTDAVGLTDAPTVVRTSARSQTDTAGITDSVTAAIGKGATITNAVGVTDAATRVVAASRTVTDLEDIDDPQSQTNSITSSGSDDVGITDAVTRAAGKGATITNAVGITDTQARTVAAARTQIDAEGITDNRATARTVARAQTDLAGITDARAAGLGVQRTITDAENLTDSRATTTAFGRTSTDSVGITDSESIDGSKSGSTTNTVGITDAAAKTQAITRSITDQVGLVDSNFDGDQEEFANAVGITDSITVVRGVGAVVTNTVGITDAALRALAARRALTDSSDVFSYGRINAASDVDDGSIGIADEMLQTVGYEPIITDSIDIADDALTGTTYLDLVGITDEVDVVNRVVFIEIVDSIRLIDPPDVIRDSNVELADELGLVDQQTDYKFRVAVITDTVNPRDAGAFNPDLFRGIHVLLTGMGVAGLTVESLATVSHAVSGPGIEPIVSTGPAAAARKTSGPHVARTVTGPEV